MKRTQQNVTRHTKKQSNKSPEGDTKEMEIYELPDKEFKVIVLNKLKCSTREYGQ